MFKKKKNVLNLTNMDILKLIVSLGLIFLAVGFMYARIPLLFQNLQITRDNIPEEKKNYGDYVSNVIHISSRDTLVQLHTNRDQDYFNKIIFPLTLIIAGGTIAQVGITIFPEKT